VKSFLSYIALSIPVANLSTTSIFAGMQQNKKQEKIGWVTAAAIVVASMIGTGVFTSLGFQLVDTQNTWSIIMLWSLGAVVAICGALSYAELGTHLTRSGGEYHFISEMYNPTLGYLSGWVSITVAFAGSVALAAMALGAYTSAYVGIPAKIIAVGIVVLISFLHTINLNTSSQLQNWTTALKLLLIIGFIVAGFSFPVEENSFNWSSSWQEEIWLPAFAVSFVYVTYSYTGWNTAAYIAEEIDDVQKNLPIALLVGTLIVSVLYILLNIVFLRQSPLPSLIGQVEIGQVVATDMVGDNGAIIISLVIGAMLVSTISAMIWVAPRVVQVMAEDHSIWRWLRIRESQSIPRKALWFQAAITLTLILTGTFEQILIYSGFILQLVSALAVSAVFILRRRTKQTQRKGFRSPFFPIPQYIFLAVSIWACLYLLFSQPLATGFGLLNLIVGWGTLKWSKWMERQ
jgi:APA family basic amino acid/polyamine antiporter